MPGKTVLASLIVEEATVRHQNAAVLYFYRKHGDPLRDNFIAMARSPLAQAMRKSDKLVTYLYEKATMSGEATLQTRTTAEALLGLALGEIGTSWIVIDGLDEATPKDQDPIAKWICKYISSSTAASTPSYCVFLSQDDTPTKKCLSKLTTLRITKDDKQHQADIEAYCQHTAKGLITKFDISTAQAAGIATRTAQNVEGNSLLWSHTFCADINSHVPVRKIGAAKLA